MNNEEKNKTGVKITIIIGVFVILLVAIGIIIKIGAGDFFYVTFNDAKNLQPGDPVMMRGIKIGEVRAINLHKEGKVLIKVWIKKDYLPFITASSTARIVSQGMPNVSGRKYLEWLIVDDDQSEPLLANSVIEGSESIIDYKLKKVKRSLKPIREKARAVYGAVVEEITKINESFSELKDDMDFEKLSKKMNDIFKSIKNNERVHNLGEKTKEFKQNLQEQYKKWDSLGKKEIAEKFRKLADYLDKTPIEEENGSDDEQPANNEDTEQQTEPEQPKNPDEESPAKTK